MHHSAPSSHFAQVNQSDRQRLQAIQTWYEPALRLLTQMLEQCRNRLRRRGHDPDNAAVHKDDFRRELCQRHHLNYSYAHEIERSLGAAGRVEYIGANYIILKGAQT